MGTKKCTDKRSNLERRTSYSRRKIAYMNPSSRETISIPVEEVDQRALSDRRITKTDPRYCWRRDGKWCSICLDQDSTIIS